MAIAATGKTCLGEISRNRYLKHASVVDVMALPVVESRGYVADAFRIPCEKCGEVGGVETHHWAPEALFSDSLLGNISIS